MTVTNSAESSPLEKPKSSRSSWSMLLFVLIVGVFIGARLWRLTSSCLWFDEIFSVHAARHNWHDLFYFVAADIIHPPLFYALLKLWISLGGESLLWLRLLPALIAILSIVPYTLLVRELRLKAGELNLALLLLAVSGYLIKYAQEVRMYSLLFLLSVCSLWLFSRWFNRDRSGMSNLSAIFLVNLLLVYTHYAGWIVILLEGVILLTWQRRKLMKFLMSVALLGFAYAPWIYVVLKVARSGATGRGVAENIGWVTRPGAFDLVQFFVLLNRPLLFIQSTNQTGYSVVMVLIAFVLFGVPLSLWFSTIWRDAQPPDEKRKLYSLIVFLVAPVVLAFILSWILPHSIWGTRHLIFTAAPYSILAALALTRLRPALMRTITLVTIGCWISLSAVIFTFSRPTEFIWCSWESLAQEMAATQRQSPPPVQVYAYEDLVAYHLWFALESPGNPPVNVTVIKGTPGLHEDPAYFLPRAFSRVSVQRHDLLEGDQAWVAFRASEWDDTRPPLSNLKMRGFEIGQVFSRKAQGQEAFLVQLNRRAN